MTTDKEIPAGESYVSPDSAARPRPYEHTCGGRCLADAKAVYERAMLAAKPLARQSSSDITKRFQFLYDVTATDKHKEAEIILEHSLALYEALYGQEDASVAEVLRLLAQMYTSHGNTESAAFMTSWANDIQNAPKEEPTHEFFHLFGMDKPDEDQKFPEPPASDSGH